MNEIKEYDNAVTFYHWLRDLVVAAQTKGDRERATNLGIVAMQVYRNFMPPKSERP